MIKNKSPLYVQSLVRSGASVEVDGSDFSALDLARIAELLMPATTLRVANSAGLSEVDKRMIALSKPVQVSFT